MFTNYLRGLIAENIASTLLKLKFYKILEKRFKTKLGEIDIIAVKNKTLIFIEVKQRKNPEQFLDVISDTQQKRIINSALIYLQRNPKYQNYDLRFDVIFIKFPWFVKHIRNAFIA